MLFGQSNLIESSLDPPLLYYTKLPVHHSCGIDPDQHLHGHMAKVFPSIYSCVMSIVLNWYLGTKLTVKVLLQGKLMVSLSYSGTPGVYSIS